MWSKAIFLLARVSNDVFRDSDRRFGFCGLVLHVKSHLGHRGPIKLKVCGAYRRLYTACPAVISDFEISAACVT
jgi:hypothetical protein